MYRSRGLNVVVCMCTGSGVLLEMKVGIRRRGLIKGLKVPCLFMIAEVSIRCQKNVEVGIRRIPAYTPQYTTVYG